MNDEKEVLTTPEKIELKRKGSSDFLRVPAKWRTTIQGLQGHLEFDATVKRDENGIIFIIFRKVSKHEQNR